MKKGCCGQSYHCSDCCQNGIILNPENLNTTKNWARRPAQLPNLIELAQFPMTRLQALQLLTQCVGDEIWSVELCRSQGVPDDWIEDLADCYESGFRSNRETIYYDNQMINQYHGIRDLDLAYRLANFLGVETERVTQSVLGPRSEVRALQEAVEEL